LGLSLSGQGYGGGVKWKGRIRVITLAIANGLGIVLVWVIAQRIGYRDGFLEGQIKQLEKSIARNKAVQRGMEIGKGEVKG
jgi:hypothetical protein